MRILQVYPKDWYVTLEFSLAQVNMLLDFLDRSEYHGDSKDPDSNKAFNYVKNDLFKNLEQLTQDMQKESDLDGS